MKKYRSFLNKHKTELTDKEFDYLVNFECKSSNFYGLPKIHKNKKITEACAVVTSNYVELKPPNYLTFRPIVAGPACETHRLSNLLDILLQPCTKYVKICYLYQRYKRLFTKITNGSVERQYTCFVSCYKSLFQYPSQSWLGSYHILVKQFSR